MADLSRALLRDGSVGSGSTSITTATFAARGSGSSVGDKKRLTNALFPAQGVETVWDGTYWRVLAPTDVAFDTTVSTAGIASASEQVNKQLTLPAGLLRLGRSFAIRVLWTKSGTTDAATNVRLRIGTAGTTADTQVFNTNGLGAANRSYATSSLFFANSATQLRALGTGTLAADWLGAGQSTTYPQNFTVADLDANALIVSTTYTMAGTTDTPNTAHMILTMFP